MFEKFNISLPSFMTVRLSFIILTVTFLYTTCLQKTIFRTFSKLLLTIFQIMNQAYSIALLCLKIVKI